jgi:hypothetical protein
LWRPKRRDVRNVRHGPANRGSADGSLDGLHELRREMWGLLIHPVSAQVCPPFGERPRRKVLLQLGEEGQIRDVKCAQLRDALNVEVLVPIERRV